MAEDKESSENAKPHFNGQKGEEKPPVDEPTELGKVEGYNTKELKSEIEEPPPPPPKSEPPAEPPEDEIDKLSPPIPDEAPSRSEEVEEYDAKELKNEIEKPPPPPPKLKPPSPLPDEVPSRLGDVEEYDAEELKNEIEGIEIPEEEKTPEDILKEIKEERKRLEKERKEFLKEMKKNNKKAEDEEKKDEEEGREGEEEKPPIEPRAIKSFVKERRKRKTLERTKTYLMAGEYVLLIILLLALLYSEGTSINPFILPIESSIYLITIFFLIMKGEKFYFRFMNMKYSGTLQRKVIGVEHYKGIEIPPTIFTIFVIAVFIIPPTQSFIRLLLDILSVDGEGILISSNFIIYFTLLLVISLIMSIVWIIFLIRYKAQVIDPELKKISEPFVIEDVFLITHSGLLLKHLTRELKPGVDDDILTGMLTAVKDFVKDSFHANEEGELDELQYGNLRIIIEYGKEVYLAAVIRGQETSQLRPEMRRVIKQIQRKFGQILQTWDGSISRLKGIENLMQPLFRQE